MDQQKITEEELNRELKGNKTTAAVCRLIGKIVAVLAFICVVTGQILLAILLIILACVLGSVKDKKDTVLKKQIGENLVKEALQEVLEDVIYEPFGKIGITQIQGSGVMIPLDYNCAEGNDHIKAVYKDLNMEFSDIILCQDENIYNEEMQVWENKKREVFKGQWLICDLGRELSAQVSLFPRTGFQRLICTDTIKTGNEVFDKHFTVRSDDGEKVFHILTPHMIEYILSAAEISGGKLYMSFLKEGKLHIAVESDCDFFEAGKGSIDADRLREKFTTQIRWFTDMIDELRLTDTLYR